MRLITLRLAGQDDADDLLRWRNDPQTQAASRSTDAVAQDAHDRWMKFSVLQGYPQHIVMIAECGEASVGTVRFDGASADLMTYEVSITMAPEFRGHGLAAEVLRQGCRVMKEYTLDAEIREQNAASRRIFEQTGFDRTSAREGFITYRRNPS